MFTELLYVSHLFRNDRITIKAIGVGNVVSMEELDCISSPNQTETTKDFSTLPDIKNQLVDVACDIPVGKIHLFEI